MSKKNKLVVLVLVALGVFLAAAFYLMNANVAVLEPAGQIGQKQRNLMIIAALLSIIVVIPVFTMLFMISWKYREGNQKKTKYDPDWDHSRKLEFTWWAIPSAIIMVLAVITWNSSHDLDPFRPLRSNTKPLNIQVVALQWKWLFIYPDQNIATANYLQFPVNTPLNFTITSDAPMNSFWIPQLGGQIYAMPGMSTQLHLIANRAGNYSGKSANISGEGFSRMNFTAKASSAADYNRWLSSVHQSNHKLSLESYSKLAQPNVLKSPTSYSEVETDLYGTIMNKYEPAPRQMEGMQM